MKRIFIQIFKAIGFKTRDNRGNTIIKALVIFLVVFFIGMPGHWGWAVKRELSLTPNSLAWQMEELTKWVMRTRNLVPYPTMDEPPFYVINSLELSGSVDKNRFTFSLKGSVLSDKPLLIPLFGPPDGVMLTNVTINQQPAVMGFESKNYYYVKTNKKDFIIKGEVSFLNQLSFQVPGPVNLFTSDIIDGRVVEGKKLPGLRNTVLHLETGKRNESAEILQSPLFQVSRAIRIQKEITFEYQVKVRSGTEISKVEMPMKYSEIVLDVPGVKGWKMEKRTLLVPASGRNVQFTVTGRLPKIGVFKADDRSNYEWWLIESDAEHRLTVNTNGKPVDSSRSPVKKKLSSSRLFLLSKGQDISIKVHPLTTLEALAVVITSQFRKIIWTKNGELVAEDRVSYQNNGIDYIPFNCSGKPIYLELDESPKAILSDKPGQEGQLLIPLEAGKHSFCVQSTLRIKPSFFGGILRVPTATHNLMVSRSSVRIGLPAGIIPVWFFGGEQVGGTIDWKDLLITGITLLLVWVFVRDFKVRIAGFTALFGLYLLSPRIYMILFLSVCLVFVFIYIKGKLKSWKKLIAFGILNLAVVGLVFFASGFFDIVRFIHNMQGMATAGSSGIGSVFADYLTDEDEFESIYGGGSHVLFGERTIRVARRSETMDENVLRGVIPVPLSLPGFKTSRTVTKESVTKDQPLIPKLFYVTWITLLPLILLWLFCWGYVGFRYRHILNQGIEDIKDIWKQGNAKTE
jgi:hypothetical protein